MNDRIQTKTVRLIVDDKMIGVVSLKEALVCARTKDLDLVIIAEGDPPIAKVIDAGRYRYERAKFERGQARKQRETLSETKEIQLRPVTDGNDILIKARKAREFLEEGDKVKVTVRFKGRERSHKEVGIAIIEKFLIEIGEHKIEKPLSNSDGDMTIYLGPLISKAEIRRKKDADRLATASA